MCKIQQRFSPLTRRPVDSSNFPYSVICQSGPKTKHSAQPVLPYRTLPKHDLPCRETNDPKATKESMINKYFSSNNPITRDIAYTNNPITRDIAYSCCNNSLHTSSRFSILASDSFSLDSSVLRSRASYNSLQRLVLLPRLPRQLTQTQHTIQTTAITQLATTPTTAVPNLIIST